MIFYPWIRYPRRKPKKDGPYLCMVSWEGIMNESKLVILHYNVSEDKWINKQRKLVFDGYKVYKQCREPLEYNRVYEDGLCEMSHVVIAYRRLPKIYGRKES